MIDLYLDDDPSGLDSYNLFITYPVENNIDYTTFMSRLSSATEAFKWNDVTDTSDNFASAMDKADALVVLSGLWDSEYKNKIDEQIKFAQTFEKPIIIIRPYGLEEIPEDLNDVATRVVGWNTACIVDAILMCINGEEFEF